MRVRSKVAEALAKSGAVKNRVVDGIKAEKGSGNVYEPASIRISPPIVIAQTEPHRRAALSNTLVSAMTSYGR